MLVNGNAWIAWGVIVFAVGGAFSVFAIPYGFHLKDREGKIASARKEASEKVSQNQVAIFQQVNNKFVFQSVKDEQRPTRQPVNRYKYAGVIFSPSNYEIANSYNVSAITDNGRGDVSIIFAREFPDSNYFVYVTGNKSIDYKIVYRGKEYIRLKFDEEGVETLKIVCTDAVGDELVKNESKAPSHAGSEKMRRPKDDLYWDFSTYFLGMSAVSGADIHISSFQVKGKNLMNKPVKHIDGLIRSNINNKGIPILLESMPPEKTNGIPIDCEFWVRALFRDADARREGIAEAMFLKDFGDFTFVFSYDGKTFERRFKYDEVYSQIDRFRRESNPPAVPTVTPKKR